jgi:hypothetical protein
MRDTAAPDRQVDQGFPAFEPCVAPPPGRDPRSACGEGLAATRLESIGVILYSINIQIEVRPPCDGHSPFPMSAARPRLSPKRAQH